MDLSDFPFDEQVCDIVVASWTYDTNKMTLQTTGPSNSIEVKHKSSAEMVIMSAYAEEIIFSPCCIDYNYSMVC